VATALLLAAALVALASGVGADADPPVRVAAGLATAPPSAAVAPEVLAHAVPPLPFECTIAATPANAADGEHVHVDAASTPSRAGDHTGTMHAPHDTHVASSSSVPDGAAAAHSGHAVPCQPTPEQQQAADALLSSTARAIRARFPTTEHARLAGYKPASNRFDDTVHYRSAEEEADPRVLDPNHPEALVFASAAHGGRLLSAMYIMPNATDPGPRIGGCLTTWHRHTRDDGGPMPEMLHVWIVPNLDGQFAETYRPPS
jgi:hypothetical protein